MKRTKRILSSIPVAMAALLLVAAAPGSRADEKGEEIPFEEADIFFELNDTDGDLGLHALVDGDAWKTLDIESPDERRKLTITATSTLKRHGLTEIFFESDEPSFDELPPEEFFARFPEGMWEFSGLTVEGDELESADLLSHVLAAPPENIFVSGVPAAENCDADPLPAVGEPVVIDWDPVTESHSEIGEEGPIEVVKYQLVVEREEPTLLVLSVDLPPEVTEFEVPKDFTALGDAFKFEIIVREAAGNQTAVESCFEIE